MSTLSMGPFDFLKKVDPITKREYHPPFAILSIMFIVGIAVTLISPMWTNRYLINLAVLLFIALASLALGGLTGFLFGIPRSLQEEPKKSKWKYLPNTNLEQVSDWLTKILLGIGLTQLAVIPERIELLSDYTAKAFSATISPVLCGSLMIYFAILGFFFLYLWARLQFGRALSDADNFDDPRVVGQAISILEEIEPTLDDKQREGVANVKKRLEMQLGNISETGNPKNKLTDLSKEYEKIRREQAPGTERTKTMSGLVTLVRSIGAKSDVDADTFFRKGGDGNRIIALGLARANPNIKDFPNIMDCIKNSTSAFEQFQALRAAEGIVGNLSADQKNELRTLLNDLRTSGKLSQEKTKDRWDISGRILNAL